jgi:hypothetical protein
MKERIIQPKKVSTDSFSIPALRQPTRGFGSQSSGASSPAGLNQPLVHDISRVPLRRPQTKLTINQPGDIYEQEADAVAKQVMEKLGQPLNHPSIQRQEIPEEEEELQMKSLDNSTLQRESVLEEDEEELQMKSLVQRQAQGGMAATPDLETSINQARGGGEAIAPNIRQPMEQAFGADFSGVKVHTDGQSDELNQSIQARAFTTGQDVFFRQGEYNPGSRGGQELLAHELTHVVQQNGGKVQPSPQENIPENNISRDKKVIKPGASTTQRQVLPEREELQTGSQLQRMQINGQVQPLVIQRRIVITPDAYAKGMGVESVDLTQNQIKEYIKIAVYDDYLRALKITDDEKALRKQFTGLMKSTDNTETIPLLNSFIKLLNDINIGIENRDTRYATSPNADTAYQHTDMSGQPEGVKWGSKTGETGETEKGKGSADTGSPGDKVMWEMFGSAIGKEMSQEGKTLNEVKPRGHESLTLKQLPWDLAKTILPKPLINLMFDVRFQLEGDRVERTKSPDKPVESSRKGKKKAKDSEVSYLPLEQDTEYYGKVEQNVIDERTEEEKSPEIRQKSPNAPGTLRSWHQDSNKLLPDNEYKEASIPDDAMNLHNHYAKTSQSGAGASIKKPIEAPMGYAEYTGTGSDWEHNTKIVLDYIQKKVYLTLTHYQYWALIPQPDGKWEFFPCKGQELQQAQGVLNDKLKQYPDVKKENAIMMSPWMEILMPTGSKKD